MEINQKYENNKLINAGFTCINLIICILMVSPALLIWIVSLGAIQIDIRKNHAHPLIAIPGWTKHELTWYFNSKYLFKYR